MSSSIRCRPGGAEVDGAPEEGDGRMGVAALLGRLSGRGDERERPVGEEPGGGRVVAELDAIAVGLLEVVAEDEVVLAGIGCRAGLQPVGEALVELGPLALGQAGIGGVADEEVAEAIGLVIGEVRAVGADQVAARQASEAARELAALVGREQLGEGAAQNVRPMTAARSRRRRSASGKRSSRAARSAPIVGGIGRSPAGLVDRWPRPRRRPRRTA